MPSNLAYPPIPISKPIAVNPHHKPIAIIILRTNRRCEITGWRPCSKIPCGTTMRSAYVMGASHWPSVGGMQEDPMLGIEAPSGETFGQLLACGTLAVSWVFVQVVFALYYAHQF